MKKVLILILLLLVVVVLPESGLATNGSNLIAIGPIARAMGGVGIAAPEDAISAVFANPAAMCFSPYCPSTEFDFAGTIFMPDVSAEINVGGNIIRADGENNVYPIPAFGLSVPITQNAPFWRFGIAAYGVSGLGVDYRDTSLDQPGFYDFGPFGQFPLIGGEYTDLSIMKFAPSIAFQPYDNLSFGLAAHVDYGRLDLRQGSSANYGFGIQAGLIYKILDSLSLGFNYTSPQNVKHNNVFDFDGNGILDTLELESPQQAGVGLAYTHRNLLLEADVKWLNWSSANGYEDFDWKDQWVFALGAQYKPIPKLALRAGYNYGKNPVETHNNFNGMSMVSVQGKSLPAYYYETFRIIGFPAVVEHHLTAGIGYEFTSSFALHASLMYAFENDIQETGTNIAGQPVILKSNLRETSAEFGLTWRF